MATDKRPVGIKWGLCTCRTPKTSGVFPSRRGNGKSTIAVSVDVNVPNLGVDLECSIWGRYDSTPDGHKIEFEAAPPRGVSFSTEDERTMFHNHVLESAQVWVGFDAAIDAAEARLLGLADDNAKVKKVKLVRNRKSVLQAAPEGTSVVQSGVLAGTGQTPV